MTLSLLSVLVNSMLRWKKNLPVPSLYPACQSDSRKVHAAMTLFFASPADIELIFSQESLLKVHSIQCAQILTRV